ncbi:MAG: bifunctional 4-hydroxy-2-oxoglutarate aldolase/2-dehydro-3-deoxy-phosphogluconate aldolase [Cyclobacteriaceae bacterium]|nr:bifunctional 4-hydroxy-2-oxoglutarate aldolase/2-dehydro-3-deoxy-phosphogluconate aldolase [Cyclobacteriaceae bacterium]
MKTFTSDAIQQTMRSSGMVPLFTHEDPGVARDVVEAAYLGGVRVFEFTNRKKNAYDVFVEMLKYFEKYPDLMLGIGTIMDAATTKKFVDAGAHFIISPIVKLEMAEYCLKNDRPWIPGCATLTEIVLAKDNGAKVIKVFPGSVLGPGFVSSIMPVVPDLQLMITGGVEPTEQNLSSWFKAGAMCVGMGSQLFTKEIVDTKNWMLLQKKVTDSLAIIQKVKK